MARFRSPEELLAAAKGQSVGQLARRGLGATVLAFFGSVILGMQSLTNLFLSLLESLAEITGRVVITVILVPLGILERGGQVSEAALQQFGILGIVMALLLVAVYFLFLGRLRSEEETGNLFGILPFDTPIIGAEEEADIDD